MVGFLRRILIFFTVSVFTCDRIQAKTIQINSVVLPPSYIPSSVFFKAASDDYVGEIKCTENMTEKVKE